MYGTRLRAQLAAQLKFDRSQLAGVVAPAGIKFDRGGPRPGWIDLASCLTWTRLRQKLVKFDNWKNLTKEFKIYLQKNIDLFTNLRPGSDVRSPGHSPLCTKRSDCSLLFYFNGTIWVFYHLIGDFHCSSNNTPTTTPPSFYAVRVSGIVGTDEFYLCG